jgi:hypothetical protein
MGTKRRRSFNTSFALNSDYACKLWADELSAAADDVLRRARIREIKARLRKLAKHAEPL